MTLNVLDCAASNNIIILILIRFDLLPVVDDNIPLEALVNSIEVFPLPQIGIHLLLALNIL